jgi:hypothetical protein
MGIYTQEYEYNKYINKEQIQLEKYKRDIFYMDQLLKNIIYQKRFKHFIFRIVEDSETKEKIISIHHIKSGALITHNAYKIFNILSKLPDKNEVFEIEKEIAQHV